MGKHRMTPEEIAALTNRIISIYASTSQNIRENLGAPDEMLAFAAVAYATFLLLYTRMPPRSMEQATSYGLWLADRVGETAENKEEPDLLKLKFDENGKVSFS